MQTKVLLSIKPEFAERIFLGVKRYEFRKAVFKSPDVKKIIVYASAPTSKVIGEFDVDDILKFEVEELWKRTKEYSGIPKDYFDKYFYGRDIGYAIKIKSSKLYNKPLDLQANFNIKTPPQSFMYL
ncbi:MAG: ASCH domain-containing protein [Anaerolineae bacterium]|jgi:predicted transcriptional regulator|nr:ASCH domain-containing protein [Anaerolineae bacterium]MBT7190234.1 ASCH domain-containing protein [Anaerolineae bacterium]MBT7989758.1 ASCH domain-containing protein [Anaerolineae bacterium]